MGTITILPDALHKESGSRSIGGGAPSVLVALNDGSNTTYVKQEAGARWSAILRFADISGSLPAGALVVGAQIEVDYSHANYLPDYEMMQPETILVGKPAGGSNTFYTYTAGEHPTMWEEGTAVRTFTGARRRQGYDGSYLGRHYYLKTGTRFYGGVHCVYNPDFPLHNLARIYGVRLIIHYNELPVTNILSPTGSVTVSRPPVVWDYTDAEGNKQLTAYVKIFTEAQTLAAGFDPETSESVYSRLINTSLESHTPEKSFGPNGNYVVYVKTQHGDAPEGPSWSAWDSQAFTLNVVTPSAPTLGAAFDASANAIHVTGQGLENLLSWAQASSEVVASPGPVAEPGSTLTRTQAATAEPDGTWSLMVERSAAIGTASFRTPNGSAPTFGIPVTSGRQYHARASFRAATTGRSCNVLIRWLDAGGSTVSSDTGSNVTDTTTGWTEATVTATAPVGAVFARILPQVLSAAVSEDHYVDKLSLHPGAAAAWTQGGFVEDGRWEMELQRSIDSGVTWTDVPDDFYTQDLYQQTLDYWDYYVPSGITGRYRARVNTIDQNGDIVSSPWSTEASAARPALTRWWLSDTQDPAGRSMPLHVADGNIAWPNPQQVAYGLGDTFATVSGPGMKDDDLSLRVFLLSVEDYDMFRAIIRSSNTLLIQDTHGRQWFVKVMGKPTLEILRAQPQNGVLNPTRHAHTVDIDFVAAKPPANG
jgi:hypothetical protein